MQGLKNSGVKSETVERARKSHAAGKPSSAMRRSKNDNRECVTQGLRGLVISTTVRCVLEDFIASLGSDAPN